MHTTGDYLKLHFLVFLWGFTGILGKLITLPAVEMVFYRTLLAAIGMAVLLVAVKSSFKVSTSDLVKLLLTGFIVSAHWLTFFASARVSNISVSLVGFATASLWTAFLEPLVKGQRIRMIEFVFGSIVLVGLYIIFSADFSYSTGLILGVLSGLTCAVFSVINSQLVHRISSYAITFYEMVGACLGTILFFPIYTHYWAASHELQLTPNLMDWICLALLAWLCSVYAYSAGVELMKKISVFFFQLTLNLEPIYGIVMAVLIFGESEKMTMRFYTGTVILLCAVLVYPWIKKRFTVGQTTAIVH
ncbi:MAG: DMT family transporter [Cyclobacteriaceae bacterium]|nr:DMT family transporter [Cyclobacteriaceae bacterium]